jgi:hypothetical protein
MNETYLIPGNCLNHGGCRNPATKPILSRRRYKMKGSPIKGAKRWIYYLTDLIGRLNKPSSIEKIQLEIVPGVVLDITNVNPYGNPMYEEYYNKHRHLITLTPHSHSRYGYGGTHTYPTLIITSLGIRLFFPVKKIYNIKPYKQ